MYLSLLFTACAAAPINKNDLVNQLLNDIDAIQGFQNKLGNLPAINTVANGLQQVTTFLTLNGDNQASIDAAAQALQQTEIIAQQVVSTIQQQAFIDPVGLQNEITQAQQDFQQNGPSVNLGTAIVLLTN